MKEWAFFKYNTDFALFGTQHLSVIIIMIISSIVLPTIANKYWSTQRKIQVARGMAITIAFWAIIYVVILLFLGKFNYKTDLPLDICNISAILISFLMWNPNKHYFEIFYFWVLAGTTQAILTPHLYNGFPNFIFIKYWFVHAGLVVYIVYIARVFKFNLTIKSLWKSFWYFQGYVLLVLIINMILKSNYVYILHKPPTASALDYLGDWPWYILVCEAIGLLMFFLLLIPYLISNRKKTVDV